jgi:hypothetical protein
MLRVDKLKVKCRNLDQNLSRTSLTTSFRVVQSTKPLLEPVLEWLKARALEPDSWG